MLQTLIDFFESLGEFFTKIWEFLCFIFDEVTQFFQILKPAIGFFQSLISNIHPVFFAFGTAMLIVLIIYTIIGRNAGGD